MRSDYYNRDNLARKYSVEEEKKYKQRERRAKKTRKYTKSVEQAKGRYNISVDFISAAILTLGLILIVASALSYLMLSSSISEKERGVSQLKSELAELKSENDQSYSVVDSSVDIGYVYDVAVGELGMVFPSDEQVVYYDYQEEGYVRQYSDIPEE